MIDYIRGVLAVKEPGRVTIEAHGVGYAASIPLSTYERLPAPGSQTVLQIHYHVREDGHKLFGFYTCEERSVFRQLIGISKIGPKVALSILSGISIDDLVRSVGRGDFTGLQKIPGVGAKTAQRLVMELRGKLGEASVPFVAAASSSLSATMPLRDEVCAAMISLGYQEKQVVRAIERIGPDMTDSDPVEAWIRKALQVI